MTTQPQPTPYDAEIADGKGVAYVRAKLRAEGYRCAKAEDADLKAACEAMRAWASHAEHEGPCVVYPFNILCAAIAKERGGVV